MCREAIVWCFPSSQLVTLLHWFVWLRGLHVHEEISTGRSILAASGQWCRAGETSLPGHAQRSGGRAYHSPDERRAGTPRPTLTKTGTVLIERHAAQLLPCSAGGAQGDQATKGLEQGGTDCIQWPLSATRATLGGFRVGVQGGVPGGFRCVPRGGFR
jgi:hypothetical protein